MNLKSGMIKNYSINMIKIFVIYKNIADTSDVALQLVINVRNENLSVLALIKIAYCSNKSL